MQDNNEVLCPEPGTDQKRREDVFWAQFQKLLGHADVSTTMIYTHVLNRPGLAVKSPADM